MTTFGHLLDGFRALFASRTVPDKIEPQRTADVLPKRREITLKKARRIQRLREIHRSQR